MIFVDYGRQSDRPCGTRSKRTCGISRRGWVAAESSACAAWKGRNTGSESAMCASFTMWRARQWKF